MRRLIREMLTPVSLIVMAGVVLYDHSLPRTRPAREPTVDGVALGRAYAPLLVSSYADAWLEAAKAIEEGKPAAEAQKVLQDSWRDARLKAFKAEVLPAFERVLPEGTEPVDAARRSQVAELWRSFAKGLKSGN